jgi:hypothetical protein
LILPCENQFIFGAVVGPSDGSGTGIGIFGSLLERTEKKLQIRELLREGGGKTKIDDRHDYRSPSGVDLSGCIECERRDRPIPATGYYPNGPLLVTRWENAVRRLVKLSDGFAYILGSRSRLLVSVGSISISIGKI